MKRILLVLLMILPIGGLCSQSVQVPLAAQAKAAASQVRTTSPPQTAEKVPEDFIIGVEDVLEIRVWKEPDLPPVRVQVRPDGKISLPLINDVQAQGLSTKQLIETITERLKDFLSAPIVSVVVLEIHSQVVYLLGSVVKPGVYVLGLPMTILELLARAGGFTEYAKVKEIQVVRKEGNKTVQYHFDYKDFLGGNNLERNITLKNGDIVIVP
jgi:polysaccharide export outer membrane protein